MVQGRNPIESFFLTIGEMIDKPVTLFREKCVEPYQQHYPWYHQKFRRVPTIDQCYSDDLVCIFEANQQYARDKLVDNEILSILRNRVEKCRLYNDPDREVCAPLQEIYDVAAGHWFSKHGDMGPTPKALSIYMKQKHRMVWERRHGPIGSGMKEE